MRTYTVTIDQFELLAMRELIAYGRAIAQTLPDGGALAHKLRDYAQTVEDALERIKRIEA